MQDSMMDIMASMTEIQELQDQIINIQQEALKKDIRSFVPAYISERSRVHRSLSANE